MLRSIASALTIVVALSTATATAAPAELPAVTLHVGDAAPALHLSKWLKGEPIAALEPGKIYVIECWATWCGPCVAAMPHVTRMQAKYKDKGVVVIGVNVWERDPAAVEPFMKTKGDRMGYVVATDDTSAGEPGMMATHWLKAAGRNGIPCSFLIDRKGKVAWIGHPMQMERPLALLAAGKFDYAEEAKFTERMDQLSADFAAAMKAREYDRGLATIDQITTLNPVMAAQYGGTRLMLLIQKKDYAAANAQAAKLAESDDVESIAAPLAATLLSAADVDQIDTGLAVTLAERAYKANGADNFQYAALVAKAYAANRQFDKAVERQEEAVKQAPAAAKEREQKLLEEYKRKSAAK